MLKLLSSAKSLLGGFSLKSYLYIGLAFALLASGTALLTKTYLAGKHAAELKAERQAHLAEVAELNLKLNYTKLRLDINTEAQLKDQQQAAIDAREAEALKGKIDELQAQLSAPDTVCFGSDDTRRLQELFGNASPDSPKADGPAAP